MYDRFVVYVMPSDLPRLNPESYLGSAEKQHSKIQIYGVRLIDFMMERLKHSFSGILQYPAVTVFLLRSRSTTIHPIHPTAH